LRTLGHGKAGAAFLSEAGHPELARTLIAHPVTRFNDPDAAAWTTDAPIEERMVVYADKRATGRVVSLEQRFDRWQRKHPEYADQLDRAYATACRLETVLCETISIEPTEVERLRWVDDAMARAFANGSLPRPESGDGAVHSPAFAPPADPSAA